MKRTTIIKKGLTIYADHKTHLNIGNEKGMGQVKPIGSMGFEMNISLHGQEGDVVIFSKKSEAIKELVTRLTA